MGAGFHYVALTGLEFTSRPRYLPASASRVLGLKASGYIDTGLSLIMSYSRITKYELSKLHNLAIFYNDVAQAGLKFIIHRKVLYQQKKKFFWFFGKRNPDSKKTKTKKQKYRLTLG